MPYKLGDQPLKMKKQQIYKHMPFEHTAIDKRGLSQIPGLDFLHWLK